MPTLLITGANRGIGLEFVRQYAADGWKVIACCRRPAEADALNALQGDITVHALNVADIGAVKALAAAIDAPLDLLIVNAGVYGNGGNDFGSLDYDVWRATFDVNVFGAVATAEAFAPHVKKAKGKIALISSKMGSIADASGAVMIYRTSKSALNMASLVIAAALAGEGVAVAPFHPGWVKPDMGGPAALIDVETCVAGLRQRIEETPVTSSPKFLAYDGAEIPW